MARPTRDDREYPIIGRRDLSGLRVPRNVTTGPSQCRIDINDRDRVSAGYWLRGPLTTGPMFLAGELDLASAEELSHALQAAVASPDGVVTVDLSGVTFIDLVGVRVLLDAARRLGRDGGRLRTVSASPSVNRLLGLLSRVEDLSSLGLERATTG